MYTDVVLFFFSLSSKTSANAKDTDFEEKIEGL